MCVLMIIAILTVVHITPVEWLESVWCQFLTPVMFD